MKKSFTLMEIVMVVVIIGILSTLSIATYQQVLDNARQKVCATNLKTLETAVSIYSLENDALPASLSDLKPEHLKKAYAKVIKDEGWLAKFSYFFVKLNTPKEAYAYFLSYDNLGKYGAAAKVFHCPSDTNGGISYGINRNIAGKKWSDINDNATIVGDCDNPTFSSEAGLAHRHIKNLGAKKVALWIKKNGQIKKHHKQGGDGWGCQHGKGSHPSHHSL